MNSLAKWRTMEKNQQVVRDALPHFTNVIRVLCENPGDIPEDLLVEIAQLAGQIKGSADTLRLIRALGITN